MEPGKLKEEEAKGLSRGVFELACTHELVAFHGDGDFKRAFRFGATAAENLAETADANRRGVAGEGDDVLDLATDIDAGGREEADPPGTDVAGLFGAADTKVTQLQNMQGEFQLVPLCAPLFQQHYCTAV